ncbi:PREDICTED: UDP-glycosyltransferase 82A1 [Nelumbo nucifera]|uniref:Glycosyltransferase n=2 Tax=Nelumbo nucifera TaxID=4432 RepID=A0A822ZHA3_NELNU|nr:PREDICTED: UDP-glycosyltransferase 82A1 [Nelumbo nucifera]DAD43880.1 TPA_asm: hypothetical protein HUJ06_002110 [Nelumbo nucifera]
MSWVDFAGKRTKRNMEKKARIVLVPYPAQGHVTPMVQLALALRDLEFDPVLVVPDYLHLKIMPHIQPNYGVSFISIPDGLSENEPRDFFTIAFSMENSMPAHLERIIRSFSQDGRVACVVVDFLASWAIEVAGRCGVPVAGFWPAMLAMYRICVAIPDMIKVGLIDEFGSPQQKCAGFVLPGQPMFSLEDLPWLVGNSVARKSRFAFWLRTLERSRSLKWLLVNSFPEERDGYREQLQPTHNNGQSIFPVGALIKHTESKHPSFWEEDMSCLDWLGKQKPGSVIYVSFGSWVAPIGDEKIQELALGLEATKRPFILVLAPMWRKGLPVGFLERVGEQGKVVSWAPQKELLQREEIGCYLTHCGWNSTMEAIQGGKLLLCYPVSGDQFVNCTYIVDVWGVGEKLNRIGRRDVEEGVRSIMEEGGEMQQRMIKLKTRAVGKEGNLRALASLKAFTNDLDK